MRFLKRILLIITVYSIPLTSFCNHTPFVKIYNTTDSTFILSGFTINSDETLQSESIILKKYLKDLDVPENKNGTIINLTISDIELPIKQTRYKDQIYNQGYLLRISSNEINIESQSAEGIFYGIQTLYQILKSDTSIQEAEIKDWPDLPMRMIMLDPARQHENKDYYRRLIEFCGQYKINYIQVHLTDHESSVLFHPDYPDVMHHEAWKNDDIAELTNLASEYHITLIPEIESFGHSRMFIQMEDAKDYLHQTELMETDWDNWIFIDIPGYTNMLCPSSDKAISYIEKMYQQATVFNSEYIHIGFDEVDLSNCERCNKKFGKISGPQLFQKHLNHCIKIAEPNYKKIGVWGDMILKHPEILDSISTEQVIIYDWYYYPNLTSGSVELFTNKGFDVIACPALMCAPYIIMPSKNNYENVEKFTSIAREHEILGVNTTIWVPTRYITDASWIGIAFAAEQSWSGSQWNNNFFLENFLQQFFNSTEYTKFKKAWSLLMNSIRFQDIYKPGCWNSIEDIEHAKKVVSEKLPDIVSCKDSITQAILILKDIDKTVTSNRIAWNALLTSAEIQLYIFDHIVASSDIKTDDGWNNQLVEKLDVRCKTLLTEIEQDWDRNRFANDPNKNGAYYYQEQQNLLYNFRQMHDFHQTILAKKSK